VNECSYRTALLWAAFRRICFSRAQKLIEAPQMSCSRLRRIALRDRTEVGWASFPWRRLSVEDLFQGDRSGLLPCSPSGEHGAARVAAFPPIQRSHLTVMLAAQAIDEDSGHWLSNDAQLDVLWRAPRDGEDDRRWLYMDEKRLDLFMGKKELGRGKVGTEGSRVEQKSGAPALASTHTATTRPVAIHGAPGTGHRAGDALPIRALKSSSDRHPPRSVGWKWKRGRTFLPVFGRQIQRPQWSARKECRSRRWPLLSL